MKVKGGGVNREVATLLGDVNDRRSFQLLDRMPSTDVTSTNAVVPPLTSMMSCPGSRSSGPPLLMSRPRTLTVGSATVMQSFCRFVSVTVSNAENPQIADAIVGASAADHGGLVLDDHGTA